MKKAVFFIALLFSSTLRAAALEKVSIRTPDGVSLAAVYAKPSAGKITVVMLHGLSSVKEEWRPLIDALVKNGMGALAYDARPAGTAWPTLVDDVGAAFHFLEKDRGVDRKSVVFAGASLGANVCLKYVALTGNGRAVLLLSPGLNYQGLTTEDAIGKVKAAPILIVAHPADSYAYQSAMKLVPLASDAQFWTSRKPGHGVQMFDDDLLGRINKWLAQLH